jgi:peptidoglycan/LPS O-acetylase OafA/YrhL
MRLDALLVPAAMAVLLRSGAARARLIPWLCLWPAAAIALIAIVSIGTLPRLQPLALAWLSPILILGTMLRPRSFFARFLELAPLRVIGRLSYSIYLWQQLFFVAHYGATAPPLAWLQTWPACLLATLGIAAVSYSWIERPCVELGHRLAGLGRTAPIGEPSHTVGAEA